MATLIIAEHDNATLSPATRQVLAAATALGGDVDILICGAGCKSVAEQAAALPSVTSVKLADNPAYEKHLAENVARLVAELARDYSHLMCAAGSFGKDLMPRVAALCGVSQLSDIIGIDSEDTFLRPIYAGNAIAKVKSLDNLKIITVRTAAFDAVPESGGNASISPLDTVYEASKTRFVEEQLVQSARPELTAAKVIVAGGRGVGDSFAPLETLADKLNAAIGATRAAVDAGLVSNDLQIGQTGKIVAPDLYIALGISGAIQHVAGIKDSRVIVAINKDEDAPIFQVADYGLVGDLHELLPELTEKL